MRYTYIGDGVVVISEATLDEMKESVVEIKDAIRQGYEEQVQKINKNKGKDDLYPHPKPCPNCKSEDVMYERYALTHGEYVCDCCGWGMDALTGKITYSGELEN